MGIVSFMQKLAKPDAARHKEDAWFQASLGAALVAAIFILCLGVAVINADKPNEAAQAAAPFILAALAVVTFLSVIWRGLLTTRQANEQRRQNDANDEANLAKLLQEGAKLLGEENNVSHQFAGVALLDVVISDPRHRFAVQAMNILASKIAQAGGNAEGPVADAMRTTMKKSVETFAIWSNVKAKFKAANAAQIWCPEYGFSSLQYTGGVFRFSCPQTQDAGCIIHFQGVEFRFIRDLLISKKNTFINCWFSYCVIDKSSNISTKFMSENKFEKCDFSNATIKIQDTEMEIDHFSKLKGHENFYTEGNPPVFVFGQPPAGASQNDFTSQLLSNFLIRNPS